MDQPLKNRSIAFRVDGSLLRSLIGIVLVSGVFGCARPSHATIDREKAAQDPDFIAQGEYAGSMGDEVVALQLAARGNGAFEGLLYRGGFPGYGWDGNPPLAVTAQRTAEKGIRLQGEGFAGSLQEGVVLLALGTDRAQLKKVERTSPSMGAAPPNGAIVLFDGSNLKHWDKNTKMTADGLLQQGARTADKYGDSFLHMEYMVGFMPDARGQRRSNSGVYIQNRYEVQVLDSFAELPKVNGNGSLYSKRVPLLNMTYPPLHWQTYDISFRAPRFDDNGKKVENMRISVYHNGVLIHDDVELDKGTGTAGRHPEVAKDLLFLQAHGSGGQARFRNVWLVEDAEWEPPL